MASHHTTNALPGPPTNTPMTTATTASYSPRRLTRPDQMQARRSGSRRIRRRTDRVGAVQICSFSSQWSSSPHLSDESTLGEDEDVFLKETFLPSAFAEEEGNGIAHVGSDDHDDDTDKSDHEELKMHM
uniref:Uncharacterized protein n=1 Tax=Leersia perrieri TaxID=77586 RepID=A0A0D9XV93_9ORYZ